jgi:hypothetical protein
MLNYIRDKSGGAASPQNGRPSSRTHFAAQARVKSEDIRNYQAQQNTSNHVPNRGEYPSAIPQPQHQTFDQQSHVHDPYDTDAKSIDTTIDHSTVVFEDYQMNEDEHVEAVDAERSEYDEEGEDEDEDEGEEEEDDESAQEENELYRLNKSHYEDYVANTRDQPQDVQRQLRQHLLREQDAEDFGRIEGDSYPSTTDGEPSEWKENQAVSEVHDYGTSVVPQHHQPDIKPTVPQALSQQHNPGGPSPNIVVTGRTTPDTKKIFREGANLRDRQRHEMDMKAREGPPRRANGTTQPIYQANYDPAALHFHQNSMQEKNPPQRGFRQPLQNPQTAASTSQAVNSYQPPDPAISVPAHANGPENGQFVQTAVLEEDQEESTTPICDYDHEVLVEMSYDRLKGESFDTVPRAKSPVLSDDVSSKPLVDRLEFVHKNLDRQKQSAFFNSLPTNEWEETGDWFLDRFSSIIKSSREARQKKRKVAHDFEEEIEKRHQHVSKRQQQVEGAMAKMKAQGEGLVPRSPRPPKTPKTRKG